MLAPLAPERYKVQFTANAETRDKLRMAQDLLRHVAPDGDLAVVFDRALDALLAELLKKKTAATQKPRRSRGAKPGSRTIPAPVRREVWMRDRGRCAFVGHGGKRCSETAMLEFHHVTPFARGGEATVANTELRCRAHNAYEARLEFGARAPMRLREARAEYRRLEYP